MAFQPSSAEDPLVAALPPATDYITYLTMLEYQLTPQNLPTLTKLLREDDGTLAQEIGWDLLKLLLPLLNHNPDEASRCLEVVARRGNPREVVVRVAEELEKLGEEAGDSDEDVDASDHGDAGEELPTFAGEAPRIHLGSMTLEGMPQPGKRVETPSDGPKWAEAEPEVDSDALRQRKLQALLNMLGILHPRIKTQYPSRFLATSLPAALGAYRKIPISTATTSCFLTMLETLAGKRRPALPPRGGSTRDTVPGAGGSSSQTESAASAPLPDPEAKAEEEKTGINTSSPEEKAITSRLIDAVLLEVLDEYLSSLSSQEHPSMSWTARLREKLEPQRIIPSRPSETQVWESIAELKERDALVARFGALGKDLKIDAAAEIKRLIHETEDEDEAEDSLLQKEQEPSEYPTSPSQIPFPRAGVIFLYAYEAFTHAAPPSTLLTTTELTKLIAHSFPLSATPSIPHPALLDAQLSLLYRRILSPSANDAPPSPAKFLLLIFSITPWPPLRDSAHYIATKLLHAYPDPKVRLDVIIQTLRGSTLSTNWAEIEDEDEPDPEPGIDEETGLTRSTSALQPHPIPLAPPQQMGQLKAVGAEWLKDEFAIWIRRQEEAKSDSNTGQGQATVHEQPLARTDGLDFSVLSDGHTAAADGEEDSASDATLLDLLLPQQTLSGLRAASESGGQGESEDSTDSDTLSSFLLDLPYFVATLNLLCVILPHLPPADSTTGSPLKSRINTYITSLSDSSRFLQSLLQQAAAAAQAQADGSSNETAFLEESHGDMVALQDACARATAALEQQSPTST
ncbi:YAP1-binding protein 1 [Exophiala dermatitidis]|nr:YAP1-binding protein 1 [Exophiala dermatitidis]